jgi:transcriptional regulator with XRE-family HTH domain
MRIAPTMIDALPSLIRARRLALGRTQAQVAKDASVSRTTLSHVEHGKAPNAQMDVLGRILRALDLSPRLSAGESMGPGSDPARLRARMEHQARLHAQRERHYRLAVELGADPRAARARIERAREVVDLWRRNRTCSRQYIRRWAALLALPPAALARRMVSLAEWEDALFQNTPWSWAWS